MKIRTDFEQGSVEWMEARTGLVTASELGNLVTDDFKIRTGQMRQTYMMKKLAERWMGPLPAFTGWAQEQGQFREEMAIPWFEFESGLKVDRVGLITTDDGKCACSPDGLVGDYRGLEVKCCEPPKHIEYILSGNLPREYGPQVYGSMLIAERQHWLFVAYHRSLPKLVIEVHEDEERKQILRTAIADFVTELDEKWEQLIEINGEPPPKREPMKFAHEMNQYEISEEERKHPVGIMP